MRRLTVLLLYLCLYCVASFAQEKYVSEFIDQWSVSDKSQTEKAEITYFILKSKFNASKFEHIAKQLDEYIEQNPNQRLQARIYMFQLLGKREFSIPFQQQDTLKLAEAIKLARNLQDDQLLAEIYALAADVNFEGGYLLYNLKALELQHQIGFRYFSFVQNRFFGASLALYKTKDYLESINYGKKCLQFKHIKVQHWDPMVYIFQLDIIGASYMALEKYDHAIGYYQQIIDTVSKKTFSHEAEQLWLAIAKGNIGRCLFYKGEVKKASPLVDAYYQFVLRNKHWNNVAIAQNARGEIFLSKKQYLSALDAFKEALSAAIMSSKLDDKVKATDGLVISYVNLGNTDSTLFYKKEHAHYLQQQVELVSNGKLTTMNAKILFDNSQRSLEDANSSILKLKQTRNIIIIAIALFVAITWLFFNRKALKSKLEKQKIVFENMQAKASIDKARASLQQFKTQLIEKDKLIENLSKSLQRNSLHNLDEGLVSKSLLSYVLVTDAEWDNFKEDFNSVYPMFYPRIKAILSSISAAEERLASLMFLQMSNKEIANTLGISVDSVSRSKRRLKQKLPLLPNQTLEAYILALV